MGKIFGICDNPVSTIGSALTSLKIEAPKIYATKVSKNLDTADKFVSKNSFPLIFGLSVLGSFLIGNKISKIRNESFEENANKLYQTREEARVATAKLEASKADYDSKINDDGFVVNTKEIIKTADANPNNIDKAIEETIAAALK